MQEASKKKLYLFSFKMVSMAVLIFSAKAIAEEKAWEALQLLGASVLLWIAGKNYADIDSPITSIRDLFKRTEVVSTQDHIEFLAVAILLIGTLGRLFA